MIQRCNGAQEMFCLRLFWKEASYGRRDALNIRKYMSDHIYKITNDLGGNQNEKEQSLESDDSFSGSRSNDLWSVWRTERECR